MIMNWNIFKQTIKSDLIRYGRGSDKRAFMVAYRQDVGFKYTFWWRMAEYTSNVFFLRFSVYPILKSVHKRMSFKYGISIPIGADIGPGFYIGHYGNIVISGGAKIGANCNISQGVTVGQANRGKYKGVPTIGDRVYMAAGSKIVGKIHIGNDVLIAANSLVAQDIEMNSVCVGVTVKVVSSNGSAGYVEFLS